VRRLRLTGGLRRELSRNATPLSSKMDMQAHANALEVQFGKEFCSQRGGYDCVKQVEKYYTNGRL